MAGGLRLAPAGPGARAGDRDVVLSSESLSGWGGRPRSTAWVARPDTREGVVSIGAGRSGMLARGLGRSYGDAAQLSGGVVVDMTGLAGIGELDGREGRFTALAGTSLGEIAARTVPSGWFLPVSPGTRHVTLGGAIAADVHGKNHHRDGSFGCHVERIEVATPDRRVLDICPDDDEFNATVGGMGLTGVILGATVRLTPVDTSWMTVDSTRAPDFASLLEHLSWMDRSHRYTVAWVDLSRGSRGRGVAQGAEHAQVEEVPSRARRRSRDLRYPRTVTVPDMGGRGVVNEATVQCFNRAWYAMAPAGETGRPVPLSSFFYPLDRLGRWNRLYGERGFLQYQFVVPPGAEPTLSRIAETLTRSTAPVSLAVLKRMGPAGAGMLSFPMEGWTLAVDMPLIGDSLGRVLDRCDQAVAEAGGRVYLAKDSRMRQELFAEMYAPKLGAWNETRAGMDPSGSIRSDLSSRIGLTR